MKIRTITFDFWGTLLFDGPASDERYKRRRMMDFQKILAAAGVQVTPAVLEAAYDASGTYLSRIWSLHRDVPVDAHVKAVLDAVDPDIDARLSPDTRQALIDAYARPALLVPPTVDAGALPALEALGAQGYTLAVVSNTMRSPGTTLRSLLERFRLLAFFKHVTFSDEVGIRKPDPEIFHRTLRAVGGEPKESVHVGDDAILDVQGARAAGMRVVQVTNASLKALGVHGPDAVVETLAGLPDTIATLAR